ncbi:LuxR family transcriptional regulator [Rhizobium calliandrae]|uniref:LuxR family transcriptional regulator n=1 Tax=Rhizobium calliandrae TaxID=1312182 RepID=A0ABT7KNL2_9HYPH|nr:LuxR family transcriptional regulator [Rhizobium calliandrae]MDL2410215.1 LuxR family transcriptional regulator [Rhizobium calliandrae]
MNFDFVSRIYEAAAVPELWSGKGVLHQLARRGICQKGVLLAVAPSGDVRWLGNDASVEAMQVYSRDSWFEHNPYLAKARVQKFNEPRFVRDTEVMSPEEMETSPYYRGFMRPQGFYWHAGTNVSSPSGDVFKFSVHRSFEDGPLPQYAVDKLTAFRPHLARAALVASRIRFEQIRTAVNLIDSLGLPAGATLNGRLVVANQGLQSLIPSVIVDGRQRMSFVSKAANTRWGRLLESGVDRFGGSFAVEATEAHPAMVGHFLPIIGAAQDIFSAADLLLILASSKREAAIDTGVLMALYDLSHAESEVAKAVAEGRSVEEIGQARQVSIGTVRAQLHSIFDKTGTARQSELCRLIVGLAAAAPRF